MRATVKLLAVMLPFMVCSTTTYGQIIGGAEQAKFEPGDITLFADDFSSVPLGEPSPEFKLLSGTYEIARFQDKKWIRPLDRRLRLVKARRFPSEFSLEFTFYAFKDGGPYMQLNLLSSEGVKEGGRKGFLMLQVGREHNNDYVELRVGEKPREYFPKVTARQRLSADTSHRVALQVRRNQLRLFVDGKRIAVVPFQPESPIEGIGFYWYRSFETKTPYRDAPVLLTDLRIATYSRREWVTGKGGTAQLLLVLGQIKLEEKHPFRESLSKFGAVETERGWWLPLPGEPFAEPGNWQVMLDVKDASAWGKALNDLLKRAKQLRTDAHLLVEGFAPEVKGKGTQEFWGKQVGFWLAALRARALTLWLVQLGLPIEDIRTAP